MGEKDPTSSSRNLYQMLFWTGRTRVEGEVEDDQG